jgi:hypothetical protein
LLGKQKTNQNFIKSIKKGKNMKIIYIDGSVLECNKIEILGSNLYCDDYRIVSVFDIDHIED